MRKILWWLVIVVVGITVWNAATGNHSSTDQAASAANQSAAAATPAVSDAACKSDLQCMGEKATSIASIQCGPMIEKFAKYEFKWTNGFLDFGFSRVRWTNKSKGEVTMIGDKIEFQNGFGAWSPMTYQCDVDVPNDRILDVRVSEGRLP